MTKLREYLGRDPSPVYTLCHGDFWSNNILFSYHPDKEEGEADTTPTPTPSTADTEEQERRRPK